MRSDREIKGEELDKILQFNSSDICSSLLMELFGKPSPNEDPKYLTNDYFILPTDKFNTKKEGYTTIGIYICNLHLIQPNFSKIFGYINKPFDGKVIGWIEDRLSNALNNDEINTDQFADYLNRVQWLGGNRIMTVITPSLTSALLKPAPGLSELKDKLFEENKDAIDKGDAITASKIEKELVNYAEDYLKKDEGYENFASNAKINISNNYKTMNIMKGALMNTVDGKYRVNSSDYNSGIKKEEYASLADSSVLGVHARAVGVASGGYLAKKSNQSLNAVSAGPKGSDCGTKKYLRVFIYPEMKNSYLNRYIIGPDGKLLELTSDNIDQYINKEVLMRSPMFCHMEEPYYCNMCLGNQPYNLDLENFGLAISRLSNKLLNFKLKKFHDLTIKTNVIDTSTIFKFKKNE